MPRLSLKQSFAPAIGLQYSRLLSLSFVVFLLLSTASSRTQAQPPQDKSPESRTPEGENMLDDAHASISRGVLATADWLDSFFDDPRVELELNKTRLKASFSAALEADGLDTDANANLRLVLPRFQNKLHLLVLAEPDEEISASDSLAQQFRRQAGSRNDQSFAAALQYFIKDTPLSNLSLLAGIRIRNALPVSFIGPRYRQVIFLDSWAARFTQTLRWFTDEGWEAKTRLDFERNLLDKYFFRATAEGAWFQEKKGYFYDLTLLLFQPLDEKRSLAFGWSNSLQTEPSNRLEKTILGFRYRERIWRQWLFYEVGPQFVFPRDKDFEFTPGIVFQLDVIFGHY